MSLGVRWVVARCLYLIPVGWTWWELWRRQYPGDAFMYWSTPVGSYPTAALEGFLYTPPVMLLMAPIHALPYWLFYGLWLIGLMAVMYWLLGRWLFLVALIPGSFTWGYLGWGNIGILIAAAIVLGIRRPEWWAVPLLTKPTAAIGLLWHRPREWMRPAVVVGGISLVTVLLFPQMWVDWFRAVLLNVGADPTREAWSLTALGLGVRLPLAALLILLARWRHAPAVIPLACTLALPWIGSSSLVVALGAIRLLHAEANEPEHRRLGVVRTDAMGPERHHVRLA